MDIKIPKPLRYSSIFYNVFRKGGGISKVYSWISRPASFIAGGLFWGHKQAILLNSCLGEIRCYSTDLTVINSEAPRLINGHFSVLNKKLSKEEANMLKLTGETEGIIVGLLLSGAKFNI